MHETQATMTELSQNLAEVIRRVTEGGERIVIVSDGQPVATIVGADDLRTLQEVDAEASTRVERMKVLAEADQLREQLRKWQEEQGIEPEDSVETLRRLREERDEEIMGLR